VVSYPTTLLELARLFTSEAYAPLSINWVNAAIAQLPPAPVPDTVELIEMDERYTFVGRKKRSLLDDPG